MIPIGAKPKRINLDKFKPEPKKPPGVIAKKWHSMSCYTRDGKLVKTYYTVEEILEDYPDAKYPRIMKCSSKNRGSQNTHVDLVWRRQQDYCDKVPLTIEELVKKPFSPKARPVIMYTKAGEFEEIFLGGAAHAAKEIGLTLAQSSTIYRAAKGTSNIAHGHRWRYMDEVKDPQARLPPLDKGSLY